MSVSVQFKAEPLRSIAFGDIDVGYMGIGTVLENPARMIYIQNLTNTLLFFSFDGVDDHWVMPNNGYLVWDIAANKTNERGFFLEQGTRIYVKQGAGAPTTGAVYVTVFYSEE